jgi:hypothetical protein
VRRRLFHREAFPKVLTVQLSGTSRFITFFEERALKSSTQSAIINLFDVTAEFGQFFEVTICNNTFAEFCACLDEIAKIPSGLCWLRGDPSPQPSTSPLLGHTVECDRKAENCQQPLPYST